MTTRGDLGHDAAEAGVQLGLRGDDVGAQTSGAVEDRRRGLVAGGLDREDQLLELVSREARVVLEG